VKHPTERFSDKVQNYVKYRPGYPKEVLNYLKTEGGLPDNSHIVDIGSGTGIFTRLLLDEGYWVYAVEPNAEMRNAAEELLGHFPRFTSVDGTGEETTLPSDSADMVVSATAFHWIDPVKAKVEFARILKPGKRTALIWNIRRHDADEFSIEYEKFWQLFERSEKRDVTESELSSFFEGSFHTRSFEHIQEFDLEGLIGRSFSSSFSPEEGTEKGDRFRERIVELFDRYQKEGQVQIHYTTKVYLGSVN
jgi:SAM-dependent methyltransferase